MSCTCQSGNCPHIGTDPAMVVQIPDHLPGAGKSIAVDRCIWPAVEALWQAGVATESNCCGHNGAFPRHVQVGAIDAERARAVLDGAGWDDLPVVYWQRHRLPEGPI